MNTLTNYINRRILDDNNHIANGNYINDDYIIRVSNGKLNDDIDEDGVFLPAIQFHDGSHIEHWQNGVLHFEGGPAVIDSIDKREEWWIQGKKIEPKA